MPQAFAFGKQYEGSPSRFAFLPLPTCGFAGENPCLHEETRYCFPKAKVRNIRHLE